MGLKGRERPGMVMLTMVADRDLSSSEGCAHCHVQRVTIGIRGSYAEYDSTSVNVADVAPQ